MHTYFWSQPIKDALQQLLILLIAMYKFSCLAQHNWKHSKPWEQSLFMCVNNSLGLYGSRKSTTFTFWVGHIENAYNLWIMYATDDIKLAKLTTLDHLAITLEAQSCQPSATKLASVLHTLLQPHYEPRNGTLAVTWHWDVAESVLWGILVHETHSYKCSSLSGLSCTNNLV